MIKVLPPNVANMIAAGEVVQRPASVVKELMENSVDAGADTIQIIVRDAGRTLIQVMDNGCGMSPQDAQDAFLRHSTSKLTQISDLESLSTFGFRGEALASIAAVAEVHLRTRQESEEMGYEVRFAESKIFYQSPVSAQKGCNISVKNLFYNIPARRKFLKSDATEYRQILAEFYRVVLTRPNISFKLIHNDIEIYTLPPAGTKQRILQLFGKEYIKELVDLKINTSLVNIQGFVGKPEDARKSGGNQFFFVNNRYIRSPYFHKSILRAYENLIPPDASPSYFIYFDVDPSKADINIHPSKSEAKFEDESAIFEILMSSTKESLGKLALAPSINFEAGSLLDVPSAKKGEYIPPPSIDIDPYFNPFTNPRGRDIISDIESNIGFDKPYTRSVPSTPNILNSDEHNKILFRDSGISSQQVLVFGGKYLLTILKSGLLLVDIRRARERILYERYLAFLSGEKTTIQQNLFPIDVELSEESYSLFNENKDLLERLGFKTELNNKNEHRTMKILGVPSGFTEDTQNLPQIIDYLTQNLSDNSDINSQNHIDRVAIAMARAGATGSYTNFSTLEAQLLIDSLYGCKNPSYSPSGKLCMQLIQISEVDNRF